MDADAHANSANFTPIPESLHQRIRVLQHDLQRAKDYYHNGHLKQEHYDAMARILTERLQVLEGEVHARLLDEARRFGGSMRMSPGRLN